MKLVITGPIGIGKSTIIRTVLENINLSEGSCRPVGGFYTKPFMEDGIRNGFEICDFNRVWVQSALGGFEPLLFAHIDFKTNYRVGKYGVDSTVFDKVGVAILRSARKNAGLIVMDEIGIMEMRAHKFLAEIMHCFSAASGIIAVIQERVFNYWDKRLREIQGLEIYTVNSLNRAQLPSILLPKIIKCLTAIS